ncbi:DUF4190 domain-containing protein [Streptomyces sp. NPDC091272]|uniref:DUF4190 domain-containing protein n=1 Tax=Streptomyces sp. NPDC091272 TaxID=3365981 RepID=UPI00380C7A75
MSQPTPSSDQNPWAPPQEETRVPPAPMAPEQHGPPPGQGSHPGGPPGGHPGGHPGGYGYPMPMPMPPQAPSNGMGTAALVLGIIGVLLGTVAFLFWASWLPALLALIFGIVGLGQVRQGTATNRGVAFSGLILGVVGVLFAVGGGVISLIMVKHGVDEYDRIREAEASSNRAAEDAQAREAAEEAAAEKARQLKFGETYTYPNGLEVTVSKPLPYAFDDYTLSEDDTEGTKALQVVVTVVNGGSAPVDFTTSLPEATDAEGNAAELVIDGSGRQELISGKVGPGTRKVGKTAYAVPIEAADSLEVVFNPDVALFEDLTWSGPTK